jgi:hypothetical protein
LVSAVLNDLLIIHCLNISALNVILLNAKARILFVMIVSQTGGNAVFLNVKQLLIKDIHIVIIVIESIRIYLIKYL